MRSRYTSPSPRRRASALAVVGLLAACARPADAPPAEPADTPPADGAARGDVLATLDGTPIRLDDVGPRIAFRLYQIEVDRYSLLERELDTIIEQRLLAREAARRGISVEAMLAAEVDTKVTPVTEADVDAYLAEHPGDAARGPAIRPRIAAFLAERRAIEQRLALVQRLREGAAIEVFLDMPERPRTALDLADAPARGPADAPVTVVHFASFASAESARAAAALQQIMDAHPGRIRWVHRHFLETYDELGLRAAELSLAAQDAGRFWELHDQLFARGGALTEAALAETAARLALEGPPEGAFARVKKHLDAGVKAGVERLPVIFVNGRYFSGTFSYDKLRDLVAEELKDSEMDISQRKTTITSKDET